MNEKSNSSLTRLAQQLRKQMTPEERHLWYDFLKDLPITINRQRVIGQYIADFYCASANLVIEIDGSQHYDPDEVAVDAVRDVFLNNLGLTVRRYSNNEINQEFENVCTDIYHLLFPDES